MTHNVYTALAASSADLKKPITELKENKEGVKYLIMFNADPANIVETYVKKNKENLATARGDSLVREEDELKAKKGKGKGKKKDKTGKCQPCFSTGNLRI